ncbi:MAG: winged helix-turn-helix transcriptional regulator, partial [bacterium]
TRQRLYAYLRENPGAHYREVQRALGLSNATARWHLDKLEACGIVGSRHLPGKRVLYAVGDEDGVRPVVLAAHAKNANVRRILLHLLERPGSTVALVARTLGVNPMTVRWHVNKLAKDGFVEESARGRGVRLEVAEADRGLVLRTLGPQAPGPGIVAVRAMA